MSNCANSTMSGTSASSKSWLGIGRGLRRHSNSPKIAQILQSSHKCSHEQTSAGVSQDIREENIEFVRDLIKKHRAGRTPPYQQEISEEFAKLTGNRLEQVARCLAYNSEDCFFIENSLDVKQMPESLKNKKSISQFRDSEKPEHDYETIEKSIFIKLSNGERVQVQVDSQTCWISIDFLIKIFQLAGVFMRAFCEEHRIVSKQGFIPYEGLSLLRAQFYQSFTPETEIILNQLQRLLKKAFKTYNGFDLLTLAIPSAHSR